MSKKIYRSVFEVIVLSEFELPIEETTKMISDSLPDLPDEYYCTQTNAVIENRELIGKTAVIEIEKHAQELSDFNIDAQGNELEVELCEVDVIESEPMGYFEAMERSRILTQMDGKDCY